MVKQNILGVILAGGGSVRMGRDKGLTELNGKTLARHVFERLAPQVDRIIFSGQNDYGLGFECVPDLEGSIKGPVSGLYSAGLWAKENYPEMTNMVTVPIDGPFLPMNLVEKLLSKTPSIATAGGQPHPTFANWGTGIGKIIETLAKSGEKGSLFGLVKLAGAEKIQFGNERAFFNINSPEDLIKIDNNYQ